MHKIGNSLIRQSLAIFVMAVFLSNYNYVAVLAQSSEGDDLLPRGDIDVAEELAELEVPDEVIEDSTVTAEDLGVRDQNLLPDSPFYPIKEAWREVKHAFTFSDVGDAKLDLRYASEKLIEAQKLAEDENKTEEEKTADLTEAVENYEKELSDFSAELDEIAQDPGSEEELADLQEEAVETHIDQITLLDSLEDEVSEVVFVELEDAKEQASEGIAKVLAEIGDNEELIRDAIASAATRDKGSKLRALKALEVLKAVEQKVPDEAKGAIEQAQDSIMRHFESQLSTIPEELRLQKLEAYMKHMPGDETRRLAMLDDMKFRAELPEEVLQHIEVMKAKAVEHFNERFEQFASREAREKFFEHLKRGELEDVRVLEDMRAHALDPEVRAEIEQHHEEGLRAFREAFAGDDKAQSVADRAEELMTQIRRSPDPKTFRLLEELHEELTPEQRQFVDQLEEAGKDEMHRRFEAEGEEFFTRMNSINPEDFAFMDDFQQKFALDIGGDFSSGFNQTIDASINSIRDHINAFDHPEDVEQFQRIFNGEIPPEAREAIRAQIPDFTNFVESKRAEVLDQLREQEAFIRDFRQEFGSDVAGPDFSGPSREELERKIREQFQSRFHEDLGLDAPVGSFPEHPVDLPSPEELGGMPLERRIDPSLIEPPDGGTSNVTCARGLVWVPDPTRPAGGTCAMELHSCPEGQIADALGNCIDSPLRDGATDASSQVEEGSGTQFSIPPSAEEIDELQKQFQEFMNQTGPVGFDPLGVIGKVLGIFLKN